MRRELLACAGLSLLLCSTSANALFGDDEARKAILELRNQLQSQQEVQLNLLNRIDQLTREVQNLRGQVDVLNNSLGQERQNAQSLYGDINSRLEQMDPKAKAQQRAADAEIASEQEFNTCLSSFQKGAADKAISCFNAFGQKFKSSKFYPDSLFWLGSSYYMKGQFARAIDVERQFTTKYPRHAKAPEGMLLLGMAQMDNKQTAEAKKTLNALIKKYPKSDSAAMAKKQL